MLALDVDDICSHKCNNTALIAVASTFRSNLLPLIPMLSCQEVSAGHMLVGGNMMGLVLLTYQTRQSNNFANMTEPVRIDS